MNKKKGTPVEIVKKNELPDKKKKIVPASLATKTKKVPTPASAATLAAIAAINDNAEAKKTAATTTTTKKGHVATLASKSRRKLPLSRGRENVTIKLPHLPNTK